MGRNSVSQFGRAGISLGPRPRSPGRGGFTLVEIIVLIVIIAVLAAVTVNFSGLARSREAARKATCLSNVRQIALAALMYSQDYDDVLPACVASDTQGSAHAVGGVYRNFTRDAFVKDVTARYGAQYVDGRWMWQLADLLLPYTKGEYVFNCPTLTRRDPHFRLQTYIVGTSLRDGKADPRDPVRAYIRAPHKRKVWQSGSYIYMCGHYPYGRGVKAGLYGMDDRSDPGIALLSIIDTAVFLGFAGQNRAPASLNPQSYFACTNAINAFDNVMTKPLLCCDSLGIHEGYAPDYIREHVIPPELHGTPPTIPAAMPMAFVDGHAKYVRTGYYDALRLFVSPNKAP
jgi:type II secretory pathway pseudopilin PulG